MPSKKTPRTHCLAKNFHSISPMTQWLKLYYIIWAKVATFSSNKRQILRAEKLRVKCWWNWPQEGDIGPYLACKGPFFGFEFSFLNLEKKLRLYLKDEGSDWGNYLYLSETILVGSFWPLSDVNVFSGIRRCRAQNQTPKSSKACLNIW